MFKKWTFWKFIIRRLAQGKGFLDPIEVISKLQRFAQPSEVAAPVELIRLATVLQARGLINAQAIQHNLDWVWPYWVERQFDPMDVSFIPRAFSVTHINLTHRNWTALGVPEMREYAIVDPRGLLTPFYDSWSIDAWLIDPQGEDLIPSHYCADVKQEMLLNENLKVKTISKKGSLSLENIAQTFGKMKSEITQLNLRASSDRPMWLAISVRPYNPEGVSSIDSIELNDNRDCWKINKEKTMLFDQVPHLTYLSKYHAGDVYRKIKNFKISGKFDKSIELKTNCNVGMASGVAMYSFDKKIEINIHVLDLKMKLDLDYKGLEKSADTLWQQKVKQCSILKIGDNKYQYLYDAAIRSMILHSPQGDVFPGPYTYKHFWFRDAAIIMNAMLSIGLFDKVEEIIDSFAGRQTLTGHFRSQDGEWDSNGQVLWIVKRFCEVANKKPKESWKSSLEKGARWIGKKRLKNEKNVLHKGLYPAGFSAEHLGPNDYYYWDDFWGVEGLRSAAYLMRLYGEGKEAEACEREAAQFLKDIERSLHKVRRRMHSDAMPSSPYRRLDSACIGSIVVGYPLQFWAADDQRLMATVDFLSENFLVHNGFFHDMSHSGINPYLTLYMAQVYLRAGDERYFPLMQSIADLASETGQWPEAVNPRTLGGCMGDGQHVWASAEWILMLKNCFVLEENEEIILGKGLRKSWFNESNLISFGPVHTKHGIISVKGERKDDGLLISYLADWYTCCPEIKIEVPHYEVTRFSENSNEVLLKEKKNA